MASQIRCRVQITTAVLTCLLVACQGHSSTALPTAGTSGSGVLDHIRATNPDGYNKLLKFIKTSRHNPLTAPPNLRTGKTGGWTPIPSDSLTLLDQLTGRHRQAPPTGASAANYLTSVLSSERRSASSARTPNDLLITICTIEIDGLAYPDGDWEMTGAWMSCLEYYFPDSTFDGPGIDPTPAPTPTVPPLPNGWHIGCNSSVSDQVNRRNTALTATSSEFGAAQADQQEAVNFIARNNVSGNYAYGPTQLLVTDANGEGTLGPPPANPDGWTIVALTHSHPTDYSQTLDVTGIDSNQANALPSVPPLNWQGPWPAFSNTYFSVGDEEYANSYSLDMIVEAEVAAFPLDPTSGPTYSWGYWQQGGTVGATTNFSSGNIGGPNAGNPPVWTQC